MSHVKPQNGSADRLLTPEQAAELLQVPTQTIDEWLRNGEIPSVRINEGLIRVREGDILAPDARAYFEQGCQLAHDPLTVEQAAFFFNKAIELNPRYMLAYFELGRMFYVWGHYHRALEPLKKAIEFNPSFPAYMNLGMCYNEAMMYGEAEEVLRKAIELVPDHAAAHYHLGFSILISSFYQPDRMREAMTHFRKALEEREALQKQLGYGCPAFFIGQILVLYLRDYAGALKFAGEIEQRLPDMAKHIRFLVDLNAPERAKQSLRGI